MSLLQVAEDIADEADLEQEELDRDAAERIAASAACMYLRLSVGDLVDLWDLVQERLHGAEDSSDHRRHDRQRQRHNQRQAVLVR